MSVPILGSRRKGSFPLFWVFGSLFSMGAFFVGGYSVYSCLSIDPSERDNGQFAFGIAALIAGLLMLAGVIFTLRLMSDPDNMSLVVDVNAAQGKKKDQRPEILRLNEHLAPFEGDIQYRIRHFEERKNHVASFVSSFFILLSIFFSFLL